VVIRHEGQSVCVGGWYTLGCRARYDTLAVIGGKYRDVVMDCPSEPALWWCSLARGLQEAWQWCSEAMVTRGYRSP
jgi:hypothetical protein